MLNLVSDTFDSMLSDRWSKNKEEPIKIKEYSYFDFFQFLIFLYSGQCELNDSNIFAMVDIAEFYGVPIFKDYCDQYLSNMIITAENIFPLMKLAEKYSLDQCKATLHRLICKNFQAFVECDRFLKADKQVIENIVVGLIIWLLVYLDVYVGHGVYGVFADPSVHTVVY